MADNKTQAEQAEERQRNDDPQRTASEQRSADDLQRELQQALRDLRTELARLQVDEMRGKVRQWVRENPTLAAFLATGAGILVGQMLSKAFAPKPPPLSEQVRRRAQTLAMGAQKRASDVGKRASKQASAAGARADRVRREAQRRAAEAGGRVSHQARDWGSSVAERTSAARNDVAGRARKLGESISKETEGVRGSVSRGTGRVVEAAKSSAQSASDTANTVRIGYRAAKFGAKAAKWAFVLLMARKSAGWLRKIR